MFKPVNRYILIEILENSESIDKLIVLPEDYETPKEKHVAATVKGVAPDVRFDLEVDNKIIVDRSMVEQINLGSTNYDVILDNYVIGITD